MKKSLRIILICLCLCFFSTALSACGTATNALASGSDNSNNNEEVLLMNTDNNNTQVLNLYSVITTQKPGNPVQSIPVIIRTVDDMQNYYKANESAYLFDTDKTWHTEKNFKEFVAQFNNAYFVEYSLVVLPVKESSRPVNYKVINYSVNENKLNLQIEKQKPQVGSLAMTCYHLAIEIPKAILFYEAGVIFY